MIKEAKKEIAEIAVKAAEQILKESVSENVSKKMTEEAIGKLT